MNKSEIPDDFAYHGRDKGVAQAIDNTKHLRALHRANNKQVLCGGCSKELTDDLETYIPDNGNEYCVSTCYTIRIKDFL